MRQKQCIINDSLYIKNVKSLFGLILSIYKYFFYTLKHLISITNITSNINQFILNIVNQNKHEIIPTCKYFIHLCSFLRLKIFTISDLVDNLKALLDNEYLIKQTQYTFILLSQ